jgi:hypothetical protein
VLHTHTVANPQGSEKWGWTSQWKQRRAYLQEFEFDCCRYAGDISAAWTTCILLGSVRYIKCIPLFPEEHTAASLPLPSVLYSNIQRWPDQPDTVLYINTTEWHCRTGRVAPPPDIQTPKPCRRTDGNTDMSMGYCNRGKDGSRRQGNGRETAKERSRPACFPSLVIIPIRALASEIQGNGLFLGPYGVYRNTP